MHTYEINTGELYHHGVKGMKLGVRRAQKRAERIDRSIRRIETLRENNKNTYKTAQAEDREIYVGRKAKKLKRALAGDKARYDTSEVLNRYNIARLKAKKDKSYKDSSEYKIAKKAYSKQLAQQYTYGVAGHQRIETLKNSGYSERAAKGRTFAEQSLLAVGVGLASLGISALIKNGY